MNTVTTLATMDIQDIVADIKHDMTQFGISTRELGAISGIDHSTISRFINTGRVPHINTVIAICGGIEYLLHRDGHRRNQEQTSKVIKVAGSN